MADVYTGSGGYGGNTGYGGYDPSMNPQGAASDPFAYTGGSLLTPWSGRFDSSGYSFGGGGGYTAPEFQSFNYADFGYTPPSVGRFNEQYTDPAAFRFADFAGPAPFKAPTQEDMRADPGYQVRMDAVKNAQTAGAAHGGALRTGGFQQALAKAVGNQASQEYGNVYNRAASEHDRKWNQASQTYGINQGNTKQAFDTNTANTLTGFNTRQNQWAGNANVALQEGQLGYNIAQGSWDRNMGKARQGWEDERAHQQELSAAANANAAAGSASQQAAYERDLADYNRSRDEFWTNQDRQYALLDREDNKMIDQTNRFADYTMGGYGALGNYAVGAADARASGTMGSATSPYASALSTAGQGLMFAGANQTQQPRQSQAYVPYMTAAQRGMGSTMPGQSVSMSMPSGMTTSYGSANPYTAPRMGTGQYPQQR